MSPCTTTACGAQARRDRAEAHARRELLQTARTLQRTLKKEPGHPRALLYADLIAAVLGEDAPAALRARAAPPLDVDAAREEGLAHVASLLWRRLVQLERLTAPRARAIAARMAPVLASPAQLFVLAHEASELGLGEAAALFEGALDARFPGFRRRGARLRIDRALLEGAGFDLSALNARFHDNGHLASAGASEGDGPQLTLDRRPGRGRFRQTGKRGGYGFAVNESYGDGCARGVLCSPWHDGEEYRTPKPWLVWVLENLGEIGSAR